MRRLLAAAAIAAMAALPAAASTPVPRPGTPGGPCDGDVDVNCNWHVCQPDELDCGMIPPCTVWLFGQCQV